jgi:hypothetical protein
MPKIKTQVRCPVCGFSHQAGRFKGTAFEPEAVFKWVSGLGRGRGFKTTLRAFDTDQKPERSLLAGLLTTVLSKVWSAVQRLESRLRSLGVTDQELLRLRPPTFQAEDQLRRELAQAKQDLATERLSGTVTTLLRPWVSPMPLVSPAHAVAPRPAVSTPSAVDPPVWVPMEYTVRETG